MQFALQVVVAAISLVALWVAIGRLWAAIYPIWRQRVDQYTLQEKLGRGPFDKATIGRSTRYYVRPKCTNIDPAHEIELRHALAATREDLFNKVDCFLDHDDSKRHLLILADTGMGKTSFVLNYYAHNARRSKQSRHLLALVALGDRSADERIASIPDKEDTIIFLDAFDEDVSAIADHRARIEELMKACRSFKRIVITCRTQFFPTDEEIPRETGIARLGPRKAGEGSVYEFWKLYLAPFDDDDVDRFLRTRYPFWQRGLRKRARHVARKIPLLTARPMLLGYIPDVVTISAEITCVYELYELMVDAWVTRESTNGSKGALRDFSEQLAVDIYLNRQRRGMERIESDELSKLAQNWGFTFAQWKLTGRSLLNRDAEGRYKFAHRSIMEYLFARRLAHGDERCYGVLLTDQMKRFLVEMLYGSDLRGEAVTRLLSELEIVCDRTPIEPRTCSSETLRTLARLIEEESRQLASSREGSRLKRVERWDRDRALDNVIVDYESTKLSKLDIEPGLKELIEGRLQYLWGRDGVLWYHLPTSAGPIMRLLQNRSPFFFLSLIEGILQAGISLVPVPEKVGVFALRFTLVEPENQP
jgi:hypothetical protein